MSYKLQHFAFKTTLDKLDEKKEQILIPATNSFYAEYFAFLGEASVDSPPVERKRAEEVFPRFASWEA